MDVIDIKERRKAKAQVANIQPSLTVLVGACPLYRQMPGGEVMIPLGRSERSAVAEALRNALALLEDVSPSGDATESG